MRLDGVSVRFGKSVVLRDISLKIAEGERVVVIGPSGAGKSTLLGVLNGTVAPECGQVWVLGRDVSLLSARERRRLYADVGTIYQDLCLVDSLRVVHNVNAGNLGRWTMLRSLVSLIWPLDRMRVQKALEQVGVQEKMYELTGSLSGGQRQRVAIARILVQDPAIVLADEPIASLDPERSRETMDLLSTLNREFRKTVVTSCHSVEFAQSHFDRVIGVKEGAICLDCRAVELTRELLDRLYANTSQPPQDFESSETRLARLAVQ